MSYWDETDRYLSSHGGKGPPCPHCGRTMFAADDHGRFSCFCGGRKKRGIVTHDVVTNTTLPTKTIPQVNTVGMSDEEKAKIPPINRLGSTLTEAENKLFNMMVDIDCMDKPEYWKAVKAVEEERKK
jgi:hypothetical protein